jgi:hypothetical protein
MSDAFAYLSVLLSIILGLAMAEILQAYGALLVSRSRVILYAPPLIWSALMLLMATQFWWASFGLATLEHWNFAAFCAVLLQTVMLYMGTSVILPKIRTDQPVDLRAHYYREAGPFFTFGLLFLLVGMTKDWLLSQDVQDPSRLGFLALFVSLTILALIVRRPRVHEAIAPVMAIAITIFFAAIFARL